MTIELIRQARERLEQLRAESTQGVWRQSQDIDFPYEPGYELYLAPKDGAPFGSAGTVGWFGDKSDGNLVATLHRTINAQISLLAQAELYLGMKIIPADENNVRNEIALAKVIMGVE